MIARTLITQRSLDQDCIRGTIHRQQLSCRGNTDEQLATGGEEFLGDQHCEGCPYHAPDQAECPSILGHGVQTRVIAGPGRMKLRVVVCPQIIKEVSIRVQHTERRDSACFQPFLPRASRKRFSAVKTEGCS